MAALTLVTAKGQILLRGTAPCGCSFDGRFYSIRDCTVLAETNPDGIGSKSVRHAMAVEKRLIRQLTAQTA